MSFPLSPALSLCPDEAAAIGSLITNYGVLEFQLFQALGVVMGNQHTALRLIYRDRGEERRINNADTIMRPLYDKQGLDGPFAQTIAQMRKCCQIRNQYAHSWWTWTANQYFGQPKQIQLKFVALEDWAKKAHTGLMNRSTHEISLALLKAQQAYFANTLAWIDFLNDEYQRRIEGKPPTPTTQWPPRLPEPELYIGHHQSKLQPSQARSPKRSKNSREGDA